MRICKPGLNFWSALSVCQGQISELSYCAFLEKKSCASLYDFLQTLRTPHRSHSLHSASSRTPVLVVSSLLHLQSAKLVVSRIAFRASVAHTGCACPFLIQATQPYHVAVLMIHVHSTWSWLSGSLSSWHSLRVPYLSSNPLSGKVSLSWSPPSWSPVVVSSRGFPSSPRMIFRMVSPECLPYGHPCSPARRPNERSSRQCAECSHYPSGVVGVCPPFWSVLKGADDVAGISGSKDHELDALNSLLGLEDG